MKKSVAILVAMAALLCFTAPAWAAEEAPGPSFTVQGRLLTDIGYHKLSKEQTANKKEDVTSAFVNLSNGWLRANFTSADKTTGGRVELGLDSKINNNERVSFRFAYGWWKFGDFKLVAGQNDGWVGTSAVAPRQNFGNYEANKNELINWGHLDGGRNPQVRLEWESGILGFSLSLVQPASELLPTTPTGTDIYANLPRFDLAGMIKVGGLLVMPGIGWSQVKVQGMPSGGDDTVTAWVAILPAKFTIGPFTAKGEIHMGQNNDMDWSGNKLGALAEMQKSMPYLKKDNHIEDTRQVGGFLALEYLLTPAWTLTAGFGIEKLNNDAWKKDAGWKKDEFTRKAYFVSMPYEITKNFTLQPEVSYFDYGDNVKDGSDFGNEWLAGIQFRFLF